MGIVKKIAAKAVSAKPTAKPVATVKKSAEDFEVYDMESIQLLPKGGGAGRGMSPFAEKCLGLEVGQGIKISDEKYNAGKGVASLYAAAKRRGIRFRVRKDVTGQLWLFRFEPEVEAESGE